MLSPAELRGPDGGGRSGADRPRSIPTRSPCCSSPAARPASPKAAVLRHRTWPPTCCPPWSSWAPPTTTPRWSASRPTTSPAMATVLTAALRRAPARATCRSSTRGAGSTSPATRASPTPWSCRRCWAGSSTWSRPGGTRCRALRHLAYGGGRMPPPVVERAMRLLPAVELRQRLRPHRDGSSTIAMLGPEDHRAAFESDDPAVRARLGLGRPAAPDAGAGDPRPRRERRPAGRAGRDLRPRRAGLRRVPGPAGLSPPTAGSPPTTAAGSTTTASCSSRAASTT